MTPQEIVDDYGGLVMHLAVKFKKKWNYIPWEINDLFQEGILYLLTNYHQYQEKIPFGAFVVKGVSWQFIRITKKDRNSVLVKDDNFELAFQENPSTCNFTFVKLSEKAKAYLQLAIEMPDGLILFLDKHCFGKKGKRGKQFKYAIGEYLNMDHEQVKEVRQELLDGFLI